MLKTLLSSDNLRLDSSTAFLIVSNLVPLFGVIFWGWSVGAIILLYWLENVVMGGFNIVKILSVRGDRPNKIFSSVFFLLHYGVFTGVHGAFVFSVFEGASPDQIWGGGNGLMWAVLALILSHGFSLLVNFYGKGEYKTSSVKYQMSAPYGRVVILHLVIIFGGVLVQALGSPLPALVVMIGLKIVVDLAAHNAAHALLQQNQSSPHEL